MHSILDRLPTARVIEQYDNECTIEAEVYGKGIIMWLLSQGRKVEVLKPESMRDDPFFINIIFPFRFYRNRTQLDS